MNPFIPPMKTDNIDLYFIHCFYENSLFHDAYTYLSENEKKISDGIGSSCKKALYINRKAALRWVLSQYTETRPEEIKYSYKNRKPELLGGRPVAFNISHSKDMLLVGIGRKMEMDIGVDIERMNHKKFSENMVKDVFSKEEYEMYKQVEDDQKCFLFYTAWVKKESISKVLGKGLALDFREVSTIHDKVFIEGRLVEIALSGMRNGYFFAVSFSKR